MKESRNIEDNIIHPKNTICRYFNQCFYKKNKVSYLMKKSGNKEDNNGCCDFAVSFHDKRLIEMSAKRETCAWILNFSMLRLLLTRVQGCKELSKPSKPCHVGIHWKALDEFSQRSTHLTGFQ